ncbi:MAG: aspartate/glutamate racemase family protein [Bacillota bacterium]
MTNKDKIIGVVGGMGPDATVDLFQKVISKTLAEKDQDHHKLLIYNNPQIPDRTAAILENGENPLPELIKTAEKLEKAGADFLVIPCNTAHYYYEELNKKIGIEIINMIEEVAKKVDENNNIKKVGLMGTKGVIKSKIYHQELLEYDIEVIQPNKENMDKIMEIIYTIKSGKQDKKQQSTLTEIALELVDKGAEGLILGCTELPLLFAKDKFNYPLFISQNILAEKALEKAEK